MRPAVTAVLIALWGWGIIWSQPATITGADPAYRGIPIHISVPGHPFLNKTEFSETVICDEHGTFRIELDPGSGTMVRFRSGIHDAGLYVEPGKYYRVVLPPYRKPELAQTVSPYFEPLKVSMKVVGDPLDINNQVFVFDSLFYSLNRTVILSRSMRKDIPLDSLTGILSDRFPGDTSGWFGDYRRYKTGILALNAGKSGLETISRKYLGPVVREKHPAFLELFGAMFQDFLVYYGRTDEGERIRYHMNRTHNLDSLRKIITTHPAVWNDTLADLILLQELPRMFYGGEIHKEAILILLDSMEAHPVAPRFAFLAHQTREKLSSLVVGNPPPSFCLTGTDGQHYTPESFSGKYSYLLFCTPDHYGCMMEYPFLNSYHEKHSDYLEVVSIMVTEKMEQVKEFMARNNYRWTALWYGGEKEILDNYMVRAFPVAYLVGPDGNLVLSPAPLPSDGFEQQLFRIMRSRGEI